MQSIKLILGAAGTALMLAGCSSGGAGDQSTKATYSSMVNFGDSLSDVGSYKVGTVAALGGGKYTVNSATALNWTEIVAKVYGLSAPCPAQTGLDGDPALGLSVMPPVDHPECTSYAQGGARVTAPIGPGNKAIPTSARLGQLTVPVAQQIQNHLAKVGSFNGKELVTVMAGGNDLFIQAAGVQAAPGGGQGAVGAGFLAGWTNGQDGTAQTLGIGGPGAAQAAATLAVTSMGAAGVQLAALIKDQIVAKGAKTVVVVNLPNVSKTPYALEQPAQSQAFVDQMTKTFNDQLKNNLAGVAGVIYTDAYAESTAQADNPAPYGLTNVTTPACLTDPAKNSLNGSALICTSNNVIAGDISQYFYADSVHPTPFGYELLAKFVLSELIRAGQL